MVRCKVRNPRPEGHHASTHMEGVSFGIWFLLSHSSALEVLARSGRPLTPSPLAMSTSGLWERQCKQRKAGTWGSAPGLARALRKVETQGNFLEGEPTALPSFSLWHRDKQAPGTGSLKVGSLDSNPIRPLGSCVTLSNIWRSLKTFLHS